METPFPEPTVPVDSRAEVFLGYLDFFRSTLVDKVGGLAEAELRFSRLPSGWTPIELVKHLTFVEMRWLEWGFEGRDVAEPWGDTQNERWHVPAEETLAQLTSALEEQGGPEPPRDRVARPLRNRATWASMERGRSADTRANSVPSAAGVRAPPGSPGRRH
jgi:hypothetical protein